MKALMLFLFMYSAFISSTSYGGKIEKVYQGQGIIWAFAFVNESELLINIRRGDLLHYDLKTKKQKKMDGPNVTARKQGGLLDLYRNGDYYYITYSVDNASGGTVELARAKYSNHALVSLEKLFSAKMMGREFRHFGSRVTVKNDYIYMTIGDRVYRETAQYIGTHNGKVLRLNLDGTTPKNNPFVGTSGKDEIWTLGHRNPQGIDVDPVSGEIYSSEFGPKGGDELNLLKKGNNYGWPLITHGTEYSGHPIGSTHKEGLEQPVAYWTPSISPSAMHFYRGDKIPEWKNNLFLACLSGRHLRRVVIDRGKVIKQEVLFREMDERIRDVRTSPDGYLYFSTDSGGIFKVLP